MLNRYDFFMWCGERELGYDFATRSWQQSRKYPKLDDGELHIPLRMGLFRGRRVSAFPVRHRGAEIRGYMLPLWVSCTDL